MAALGVRVRWRRPRATCGRARDRHAPHRGRRHRGKRSRVTSTTFRACNRNESMPTTYTDLIASVRKQVREVTLDLLKKRLEEKEPLTLLDVREKEEYRAGYIPGAVSIPRGFLEIQIEARIP